MFFFFACFEQFFCSNKNVVRCLSLVWRGSFLFFRDIQPASAVKHQLLPFMLWQINLGLVWRDISKDWKKRACCIQQEYCTSSQPCVAGLFPFFPRHTACMLYPPKMLYVVSALCGGALFFFPQTYSLPLQLSISLCRLCSDKLTSALCDGLWTKTGEKKEDVEFEMTVNI